MAEIRTVIAVTGEDDRYERVRRAAIDRALAEQATLILYDIDSPISPLEDATPSGWSAEGTKDDAADRLAPEELEASGHQAIARQVADARGQGLDAWGWLPSGKGRDQLIEYAAKLPGARILVPDGDDELDLSELPEAEAVPAPAR